MKKSDLKYYQKVAELRSRIKDLKDRLDSGSITLIEYREQLRAILDELNETKENSEESEFSTLFNGFILSNIKLT